jgi:hypothetical protein
VLGGVKGYCLIDLNCEGVKILKKRLLKKLARKGVEELKRKTIISPLKSRKIQSALADYLHKEYANGTSRESKVYRDFWEAFDNLRSKQY